MLTVKDPLQREKALGNDDYLLFTPAFAERRIFGYEEP